HGVATSCRYSKCDHEDSRNQKAKGVLVVLRIGSRIARLELKDPSDTSRLCFACGAIRTICRVMNSLLRSLAWILYLSCVFPLAMAWLTNLRTSLRDAVGWFWI